MVKRKAIPTFSRRRIVPVPSTWPLTRCPPKCSPKARARSRFTFSPGRSFPRFVFAKVSGMISTVNPFAARVVTVKQTPLTARLSPFFRPFRAFSAPTARYAPSFPFWISQTTPSSSTMPVNMSPPPSQGSPLQGGLPREI